MYLVLRKQLLSFKEDCVKNKIFHIQDLCLRTPGTNLLYKKCVQKCGFLWQKTVIMIMRKLW